MAHFFTSFTLGCDARQRPAGVTGVLPQRGHRLLLPLHFLSSTSCPPLPAHTVQLLNQPHPNIERNIEATQVARISRLALPLLSALAFFSSLFSWSVSNSRDLLCAAPNTWVFGAAGASGSRTVTWPQLHTESICSTSVVGKRTLPTHLTKHIL